MTSTMERSATREMVALNADVVGYSRLLADDFERTRATMDGYAQLVEDAVADASGTLVNFVGDSFMAVFDDAADAMRAAIAITREIETGNSDVEPSRQVRFRMGLDQGGMDVTGDQWYGDSLNIASRIQAIAQPGGISVSRAVYTALDEPELRFRALGRRRLKNIPEEVDVFEFTDLPSQGQAGMTTTSLRLEAPSVAILPIHVEGLEPRVVSAAQILKADLIHRLSEVPNLVVVDVFEEAEPADLQGRARYILMSGVLQFDDQVRVYAHLLDVTTMNVVKGYRWTTSTSELMSLSDEIGQEVARSLEIDLIVGEPAGLYNDIDDPAAIQNIYWGWYHMTTGSREGMDKAVALFEEVAEHIPDMPFGHVLAAFANWMAAANGMAADPDASFVRAHEQALRGMEVGDPTGMAQTVEVAVLMSQGRSAEAEEKLGDIEITRPTCDVTYALEGSVRRYLGEWDRSVDLLDRAMRLTGVNKPWYPTVQACSLYLGGRPEQAAAMAETVLEHQQLNLEALLVLAGAQVRMGLERRARATAGLIRERFPSTDIAAWIDANPYRDRKVVEAWKRDLAVVGLVDPD